LGYLQAFKNKQHSSLTIKSSFS